MGIGAYGVSDERQRALTIDCLDLEPEEVEDLISDILAVLPASYQDISDLSSYFEDGHKIIAENGLFSVQVIGWEHDLGLRVKIRDEDYFNIASANLDSAARLIFDRLAESYELRVKTSGYTTAPYRKSAA